MREFLKENQKDFLKGLPKATEMDSQEATGTDSRKASLRATQMGSPRDFPRETETLFVRRKVLSFHSSRVRAWVDGKCVLLTFLMPKDNDSCFDRVLIRTSRIRESKILIPAMRRIFVLHNIRNILLARVLRWETACPTDIGNRNRDENKSLLI